MQRQTHRLDVFQVPSSVMQFPGEKKQTHSLDVYSGPLVSYAISQEK